MDTDHPKEKLCTKESQRRPVEVSEAASCCRAVGLDLAVALPHNILQLGRQTSVELLYSTVNLGTNSMPQLNSLKRTARIIARN
jgi:hypothetical protein